MVLVVKCSLFVVLWWCYWFMNMCAVLIVVSPLFSFWFGCLYISFFFCLVSWFCIYVVTRPFVDIVFCSWW